MNKIVMRKAITLSPDNALIAKAFGIIALFVALFAFTLPSEGQTIGSTPEQKTKDTIYLKPVTRLVRGETSKNGNASASTGEIIINLNTEPKIQDRDLIQSYPTAMPMQNDAGFRVWDMMVAFMLGGIIFFIIGLLYKMRNGNNGGNYEETHHHNEKITHVHHHGPTPGSQHQGH